MAKIKIKNGNKLYEVKGTFTFEGNLIEVNGEERIEVGGAISTHKYLEDIQEIESDRYIIKGVRVYNEVFGSEDFNILYNFTADSYIIKGGESNLDTELEKQLEDELHINDDSRAWEMKGGE